MSVGSGKGGVLGGLRASSLSLFFAAAFLASLVAQAVSGVAVFNTDQRAAGLDPVTFGQYVASSAFWVDVTENWQSEMLAVLSMVVLAIYLRERGSPESKPVGSSHEATGVEG
ncbi:DUF6766 family protein [Cellulosimicrobium cellulans]